MYKTQFREEGFTLEGSDVEMACIFILEPCESVQFSIIIETKYRINFKTEIRSQY